VLSFGIVYELSFNWNILIRDISMLSRDIVDVFLNFDLRNIGSNMFNGIVVGVCYFPGDNIYFFELSVICDGLFLGYNFVSVLVNIVNNFLLNRYIFDSTIALNQLSSNTLLNSGYCLGSLSINSRGSNWLVIRSGY
jgi:hypothetical protein